MDSGFYFQLLASFAVGGCWVALATVTAERFGSKLGGVISGIPTTIVVALLFIGIIQSPAAAAAATSTVPSAFAVSCVFMVVYASLVHRGLFLSMFIALLFWFLMQWLVVSTRFDAFWLAAAVCAAALAVSVFIFEHVLCVRSLRKAAVRYSPRQLLLRAVFAGVMVAAAAAASKFAGPLWGGVFASFPSMFIATLVITYYSVSAEFSRSIAKTHMISGVINCVVYAGGVRFFYPAWGLTGGTCAAYLLSAGSSYLTLRLVKRMVS